MSDFSHRFIVIYAHLNHTKNEIPLGMSPRELIEVEISDKSCVSNLEHHDGQKSNAHKGRQMIRQLDDKLIKSHKFVCAHPKSPMATSIFNIYEIVFIEPLFLRQYTEEGTPLLAVSQPVSNDIGQRNKALVPILSYNGSNPKAQQYLSFSGSNYAEVAISADNQIFQLTNFSVGLWVKTNVFHRHKVI